MNKNNSTEYYKNINTSSENADIIQKESKLMYLNSNFNNRNKLKVINYTTPQSTIISEKALYRYNNNSDKRIQISPSNLSLTSKSNRVLNINNRALDNIINNPIMATPNNNLKNKGDGYSQNKTNQPKQILSLNKRIKRERNLKKNFTNAHLKNEAFIFDKQKKKIIYNYSHENIHGNYEFNNNDIFSYNSKIKPKRDKNNLLYSQYYADTELFTNNQNNERINNSKILKKEIYINKPGKNTHIINTYIYNSPLEHPKIKGKRYIIGVNNSYSYINHQRKNLINEDKKDILFAHKNKKIEQNKENKSKTFILLNQKKLINSNKFQNKNASVKNKSIIDSFKKTESKNHNRIKKDLHYYFIPNIYKDDMSIKKIKKNARTVKVTLDKNNLEINAELSSQNLNKNNKINNRYGYPYLEELEPNEFNKLSLREQHNLKYMSSNVSGKRKQILQGIDEEQNNNIFKDCEQNKLKYYDGDCKSVCLINSRRNLNNNIIKISNDQKSPKNLFNSVNNKSIPMIKIDIINSKNNNTNLNDENQYDSKYNKNKKRLVNSKSIIDIHSSAPNTLFKNINPCKNIKNISSRINQNKQEELKNKDLMITNKSNGLKENKKNVNNKNNNIINISNNNVVNVLNLKNSNINICYENKNKLKEESSNNTPNNINIHEQKYLKKNNSKKIYNNLIKKDIKNNKKIVDKITNNICETIPTEKGKNISIDTHTKISKNAIKNTDSHKEGLKKKLNIIPYINKNDTGLNSLGTRLNQININSNVSGGKNFYSPNISYKNNSKIINQKLINNIYIRPNFLSPNNKIRNKSHHERQSSDKQKSLYFKNRNIIRNIFMQKTDYQISQNKNKSFQKASEIKLKSFKSSKIIRTNENKEPDKLMLNKLLNDDLTEENKIRDNYIKKYCFYYKYFDYAIKMPIMNKCYINKIFKKYNQKNSESFDKNKEEIDIENIENENKNTFSLKNITFSDNIKKKESMISKSNEIIANKNKENLNLEDSDLDIYNKIDMIKNMEQKEILEDNISDNDDIKLNFSDENNNIEMNILKIRGSTFGKEIEDSEKKITKTQQNDDKKIIKYNLENAEKGLNILGNFAEKIKNSNYNNNSNEKKSENKNKKIYLGTNKLNTLFNRKNLELYLTEGNNKDEINNNKKIYRFSKSLNKDSILKGISKIENLFEKKSIKSEAKNKINTYQKKINNINIDSDNEQNFDININVKNYKLKEMNNSNKSKPLNNLIIINKENNFIDSPKNKIIANNSELLTKYKYLINDINNNIKHDIIFLLNIILERNYTDILHKLIQIILYKGGSLNNNDDIIKREHIFKDIIFNKALCESKYIILYSKLIKDLNENISKILKAQQNTKNNKEKNLKFIINEESINLLNKFKNLPNYIILGNFDSDNYFLYRKKIRSYVSFIYELIKSELLKPQFGINIIEQFHRKFKESNINKIYIAIYLDACIILFDKICKDIIESNNHQKLIQNLNNFVDNLSKDDIDAPNYLKYKKINSIEKYKALIKKQKSQKNFDLFEKALKEEIKKPIKSSLNISKNNNKNISFEDFELIIQGDLMNYISYYSEENNNGQIILKKDIDKSYNWKAIDELINQKSKGLGFIINKYIQACMNIDLNEKKILLSNDYIKNIIDYYINNLSRQEIKLIHTEMIKTFNNIDNYINNNKNMEKILGNLLFILIENKLYYIKDFNNYLKVDKNIQINLSIITKYCIISSGKFAKKYFNDFKQTKLFINNSDIFIKYVSDPLKDFFYFLK